MAKEFDNSGANLMDLDKSNGSQESIRLPTTQCDYYKTWGI